MKLELDRVRYELQLKEQQLAQYALNLASKNECLNKLEKNFNSLKDSKDEELKGKLNNIRGLMRSNISIEKEWDKFQTQFNNIDYQFVKNISRKYPILTATEINIFSLLRLQLKPKDIALFKFVSLSNIQNHISRIRRKLGLGRKDNINKFLMEL